MAVSVLYQSGPAEVKRVHRDLREGESATGGAKDFRNRVVDLPLQAAKERTGRSVRYALEGRTKKEFAADSVISEVCSGDRVPEWLARLVGDHATRRRFAKSLLDGDPNVIIETTIKFIE